jgi:hypothetical protein
MIVPTEQHEPPKAELSYAKRPALSLLGRHRRGLVWVAIFLAVAMLAIGWRRPIVRWLAWQYWMRQAAAHEMPQQGALYLPPATGSAPADYVQVFPGSSQTLKAYVPRAFRELRRLDARFVRETYNVPQEPPIVFMGALRRPDGQSRLVILRIPPVLGDFHDVLLLVLPATSLLTGPADGSFSAGIDHGIGGTGRPVSILQVFTQPAKTDPTDPTALILAYSTERHFPSYPAGNKVLMSGEMRAQLQDDDSIIFRVAGDAPLNLLPAEWQFRQIRIIGDPAVTRPVVQ